MNTVAVSIHPWIIRLLCTYVFLLPFSSKFASVVLIILLLLSIGYKISQKNVFRFSSFLMFWLMLFYILHLTGLFNTSNFEYAGLDLQIKLSFLLIPLCIDNIPISTNDYRRIARSLIAGCTLLALVLLLNAFIEYFVWFGRSAFFYIDFCSIQHVAYFTLYINCALFFLTDEFFRLPGYRLRNRYLLGIWIIFLLFIVTLLSSRTAEFAVLITFSLYVFLRASEFSGKTTAIIKAAGTALLMLVIFMAVSRVNNRFAETPAQHHESIPAPTTSNSVKHNVRFDIWNNSMQVYKEHFIFGTGTGDVKDELIKQYELSGFTEGIDFNLSPHNQYLQTLLTLGIPGIIVLLMIFIYALYISFRSKNYLLISILVAIGINMLTESMLEKQSGVLFIAFILVLLASQNQNISGRKTTES